MRLSDRKYVADKGKQFVLTEKGKKECASYRHKTVGEPVDECIRLTTDMLLKQLLMGGQN